jgi:hypothetical protein
METLFTMKSQAKILPLVEEELEEHGNSPQRRYGTDKTSFKNKELKCLE